MKKNVLVPAAALCAGLSACLAQPPAATAFPPEPTPAQIQLTGTVSTNGSTSMEKVMAALTEGFKLLQPGITVTYDSTGSGAGIEAAANGSADIGLASRSLSDEEQATLTQVVVAMDGIAIVVNPANPVQELTAAQLAALARGEIANWSALGGGDVPVAFIGREAGSGTRGAFETLSNTEDACLYTQELTSSGAVVTAVAANPGAIGYASLSAVGDSVRAVSIGSVACSEATVLDGSYAMVRLFVFAVPAEKPLSQAAQAFYDFALSPDSAPLYRLAGAVPTRG